MDPETPPPARTGQRATDGLDWSSASRTPAPPPDPALPAVQPPRESRRTGTGPRLVAAIAGVAALVGGVVGGGVALLFGDEGPTANGDSAQAVASSAAGSLQRTDALVQVAAKARPGVIKIQSTRRVGNSTEQDIGSGVVLDNEGHILTNAHVVLGTETLVAILPDGSERPAILVGHDYPFTDLAVLQVGPVNLTPIPVGDSSKLRLGETVIAIGNPLAEFDGTVSTGVVSGLQRRRVFDGVVQEDLVQTDAAINNGNSGGALLNLEGEFIAMPTAVLRENRGGQPVEGIAFALPSNRIRVVAQGIIAANGNYPRPTLGAETQDLTPELAARLPRITAKVGALVTAVADGGPAATAGIVPGDVITRIGDEELAPEKPLLNAILPYTPGQSVRVVLNRNGRIIEVEVRLGTRA